ncbi:MAG: hypothetical protein IH914_08795 [candidate division Zixibacteria bacterium]|nr:hypothetical protein [candidate division Zixibacteria bacterium]
MLPVKRAVRGGWISDHRPVIRTRSRSGCQFKRLRQALFNVFGSFTDHTRISRTARLPGLWGAADSVGRLPDLRPVCAYQWRLRPLKYQSTRAPVVGESPLIEKGLSNNL